MSEINEDCNRQINNLSIWLSLLWADRLPRPHPQFLAPALKFVQTPHLQSAVMLISCTQSRGVYKGTARADFSAELLLTQPAVI